MAVFSSSKALILSSTAALCTALIFSFSEPLLRDIFTSVLPQIWCSLLSWLAPPYLYFLINAIIISIAASSKFQLHQPELKDPAEIRQVFEDPAAFEAALVKNPAEVRQDFEDPFAKEKPLVSGRFGQRKFVKASPEGNRVLRVAKPKRHETLESTWKTITEGRSMPLSRHLKKSGTWETDVRSDGQDPIPVMKKSETMNDRMALSPTPGSGKLLRKESSLSQDELNRRVEAFIKKFNEEMRLQRQKSLQNYMEMVNHGTHQIDGV
ncbi:CFE protein [Cinnamomum micranthum f. kanehirae]|uniref:CFE protein n=1 Tax=Cinnamomum micranthum f. kanehirae TaxID=337451 RepID=A0A3S3MXN8_9MAGN|nr:CFE protein [Cinnamomum micranthum f. kanehirae]